MKEKSQEQKKQTTKQEDYGFYFVQYQTPVILFNVLLVVT